MPTPKKRTAPTKRAKPTPAPAKSQATARTQASAKPKARATTKAAASAKATTKAAAPAKTTTKAAAPAKTTSKAAVKTTSKPAARAKPTAAAKTNGLPSRVAQYREFVLSLPEAKEEIKWGSPHFTVQGKIFSGLSEDEGDYYSGVVVAPELAAGLVDDDLFSVAPYTGRYGGITMNVRKVPLEQAKQLVQMSYCRSAPARLVKLLEATAKKK